MKILEHFMKLWFKPGSYSPYFKKSRSNRRIPKAIWAEGKHSGLKQPLIFRLFIREAFSAC
jgi:hypothetical protein